MLSVIKMKHHKVKIVAKYFNALNEGKLKATVRYNDRGYGIGDTITFCEGEIDATENDGFKYSGRELSCRISYLDDFGCQHGYVNISLCDIGLMLVIGEEVC